MKARVKATGEIIEVEKNYDLRESTVVEFYTNIEDPTDVFEKEDLEFPYDSEFIDYWTRLEHTYAGMAMQGILSNPEYLRSLMHTKHNDYRVHEVVPDVVIRLAHALVEKYKKEEK